MENHTSQERENAVPFEEALKGSGLFPLKASGISVFQISLGKKCNQSCKHCHVDAGPNRTELMDSKTVDVCLAVLERSDIPTVDITGGAPEMHPQFRDFAARCRQMGKEVIVRTNLTILTEDGYTDLVDFFKENKLVVVASFPYFRKEETDAMRGKGVFEKSVKAIRRLNGVGYGREGSGLILNLMYNPSGAYLPPPQAMLEKDFKREMGKKYGLVFNNLLSLTNMPISRFRDYLKRSGNYAGYITKLVSAYNPAAAANVMCKSLLSISWDGFIYDCDFNQMLDLRVNHGAPSDIMEWDMKKLSERQIVTGLHCYGCTAGSGSSCGGQLS